MKNLISRIFLANLVMACVVSCGSGGDADNTGAGLGPVTQVGDNLNFDPSNTITCQDGAIIQTSPPAFWQQGHTSCLLLTFFNGSQPSTSGVAVSANIRIGPVTGPMRFVKMRILFQNLLTGPERACCSVEQYGEVFTPQANATTTVPLNFAMTQNSVPLANDFTSIAASDLVGLEILAPNVPIPGAWVNNGNPVLTLPNYLWLPALSVRSPNAPTQNLRSEGSHSGFLPSYNLNFQSSGSKSPLPSAP